MNASLTAVGEQDVSDAGRLLAGHGLLPDVVHASVQRRSIRTAELAVAVCDRDRVPVRRSWRLNSNHYGALQGREKSAVLAEVGERQFMAWRRSYDSPPPPPPPPLAIDHPRSQFSDPRYAVIPPGQRPRSESLKDVTSRLLPYWLDAIIPDLRLLVVSHGNTLRALIKHLDNIPDAQAPELNIPNATPLVYELGPDMRPVIAGGIYLR